jgi:hypothetical protein
MGPKKGGKKIARSDAKAQKVERQVEKTKISKTLAQILLLFV